MQLAAKRHFIHEHPEGSRAWRAKEMVHFMLSPEVDAVTIHMCSYGMKSKDEDGEGLVKKPTRIMSSAPEVLRMIERRCSNEAGQAEHHRHVHLIQGRAKDAQVYPRELGIMMCNGIAAQRRLDNLGMHSRPVMSVEQMHEAAATVGADDCPS